MKMINLILIQTEITKAQELKRVKNLILLATLLLSANAFSLTEDYILWGHADLTLKKQEEKRIQKQKTQICERLSKSDKVESTCKNSRKSLKHLNACLNTKSETNQDYCLLSKKISVSNVVNCTNSSSNENSEAACLILVERGDVKTNLEITRCAGLGPMEEITCLKFSK